MNFHEDLKQLVRNSQGIAAREIVLRISKKFTGDEWIRFDVKQILNDYLQEIGEPLSAIESPLHPKEKI